MDLEKTKNKKQKKQKQKTKNENTVLFWVISYLILLSYFFFTNWSKPQTDDPDKEND